MLLLSWMISFAPVPTALLTCEALSDSIGNVLNAVQVITWGFPASDITSGTTKLRVSWLLAPGLLHVINPRSSDGQGSILALYRSLRNEVTVWTQWYWPCNSPCRSWKLPCYLHQSFPALTNSITSLIPICTAACLLFWQSLGRKNPNHCHFWV